MTDNALERTPTGMELLAELARKTDDPTVSVAVAQSIVALQQNIERFSWEREERKARIDFDDALQRCQAAIPQIKPDAWNKHTKSWHQRYDTLDAVVRPIYTGEGFSLSFGEADCPTPEKIRTVATLSRGGVSRQYIKDMTPPNKGAQGGAVMSATHGDAAAGSYARRYLLIDIFNIAKLITDTDTDGNPIPPMDPDGLAACLSDIANAKDIAKARDCWKRGTAAAREAKDDSATIQILKAYEGAKKRLAPGVAE